MNQSINTVTLSDLQEQRNRLTAAANALTNTNQVHEFNEAIRNLDAAFVYFGKYGEFDSGERKVNVYRSAKAAEEKQDHSGDVKHAQLVIARAGLRLLQKSIPAIKEMADRCLELAGKDAVRAVCAPTQMVGTDLNGQAYKPQPSEFTLPEGYEPISVSSIARTVGAVAGLALTQKVKTLIGI